MGDTSDSSQGFPFLRIALFKPYLFCDLFPRLDQPPRVLCTFLYSGFLIMAAFVVQGAAASFLPSLSPTSFKGSGISARPTRAIHRRHARVAPLPIQPSIRCEEGQFNYNIYQDSEDRSKREVSDKDRAVTLEKPLGIVLEEGQDGMVFVAEVDPDGNAALSGEVNEGDVLVAVSATFGEEVWSTRGVGLDRVMKSIRIRAGDLVTLVLESPSELSERKSFSARQAAFKRTEARDKFGEREVLDPVSWAKVKQSDALYEDGDPVPQQTIDDELKEKLKREVVAPYEQNWILWVGAGILVLVLLGVAAGIN